MSSDARKYAAGPFRASALRSGDRYELSDGHPIYCAPTGGDGARGAIAGGHVLDTDPLVQEAGFDAGYSQEEGTLRAPDIAVGSVPDKPGWIPGTPALAVEYASVGQDEAELQRKIADLHARGTRWVWVVRLVGPRRVEVYERGQTPRSLGPGQVLTAPGVLKNEVPVEALYDREASHEVALRNLLQRKGYESLESVRRAGVEEGSLAATISALLGVLQARGLALDAHQRERIEAARDVPTLQRWLVRAVTATRSDELFES